MAEVGDGSWGARDTARREETGVDRREGEHEGQLLTSQVGSRSPSCPSPPDCSTPAEIRVEEVAQLDMRPTCKTAPSRRCGSECLRRIRGSRWSRCREGGVEVPERGITSVGRDTSVLASCLVWRQCPGVQRRVGQARESTAGAEERDVSRKDAYTSAVGVGAQGLGWLLRPHTDEQTDSPGVSCTSS